MRGTVFCYEQIQVFTPHLGYHISPYSFPRILFLFEFGNFSKLKYMPQYFSFSLDKLNICWGNYSREETIHGQKLYEKIGHVPLLTTLSGYWYMYPC